MATFSENKESMAQEDMLADTFELLQIDMDLEPTSTTTGMSNVMNCSVSDHNVNTTVGPLTVPLRKIVPHRSDTKNFSSADLRKRFIMIG